MRVVSRSLCESTPGEAGPLEHKAGREGCSAPTKGQARGTSQAGLPFLSFSVPGLWGLEGSACRRQRKPWDALPGQSYYVTASVALLHSDSVLARRFLAHLPLLLREEMGNRHLAACSGQHIPFHCLHCQTGYSPQHAPQEGPGWQGLGSAFPRQRSHSSHLPAAGKAEPCPLQLGPQEPGQAGSLLQEPPRAPPRLAGPRGCTPGPPPSAAPSLCFWPCWGKRTLSGSLTSPGRGLLSAVCTWTFSQGPRTFPFLWTPETFKQGEVLFSLRSRSNMGA